MKITRLVLVLLLLIIVVGAAFLLYDFLTGANAPPSVGQADGEAVKMPAFTVYTEDGEEIALESLAGRPVVVNIWASWCGPCRDEMPHFEKAYGELGEKITFLMVNMTDGGTETKETAQKFLDETGYTFPVAFDTSESAAAALSVRGIPVTYFLDAELNIVAYNLGSMDEGTLYDYIALIGG